LARNDAQGEWALPDGWVWTTLREACVIVLGQSPPSSTYNAEGAGLPFYQGKAEFGDLYPTPVKWCSHPNKLAEAGDILISVRAPVGPTNLCREQSCIGRGLAAIRPTGGMSGLYLLYYLRSIEQDWQSKATGTTFSAITGSVLRGQRVPLAPLPEQRRIVAEIETQFTRLDAGVAALERAQANLKRYRASVLKAACEGRLVPQDPTDEPADRLLARILEQRRARWEAEHPGKKYKEPASPDTEDLPELPEGWVWATVEQLASPGPRSIQSGPFGSNLLHSEFQDTGILAMGIDNVLEGRFSMGKQHRISPEKFEQLRRFEARPLDVLITVMATVGRCCVVPPTLETAIVTKHVYRISANQSFINPYYLMHTLWGGSEVRRQLFGEVRGQTRPGINGTILKQLAIPVPPLPEQRRIVAEVERRLSVVAALEREVGAALARAARLRQSILKRAFEGRLVAQDPDDEPASALLARIRAEREAGKKDGKTKRKKQQPQQLELL
jgi:type I restriction enzyme S subunit